MISKELFIEAVELIEKKQKHEELLCKALELCAPQEYVNTFIYSEYATLVVKLLNSYLELSEEDDILEWWLFDKNFGKEFKDGDYIDMGKNIDLSTAEKLYDYLTRGKE